MSQIAKDRLAAFYDKDRPLVFGHRGAMAYAPMNTMQAYELALQQGADGIELDVWLTQDDIPVILHDFEVHHSTNGEGRVGSMPYSEIQTLDAGSWFSEEFSGAHVPTLDEVFETLGQKLYINVEIKSISMETENIVWQTVERIRKHGLEERVLVSCFNPFILRRMRKTAPDIPIGFLHTPSGSPWVNWFMWGVAHQAWHPEAVEVTAENVAKQHRAGRKVNVWTVNEPEMATRLQGMGVDCLMTDNPDKILSALGENS